MIATPIPTPTTTSFTFTDFSNAIAGYPALSVVLTIEDLVQESGSGGTSVNVNEIWSFKVKVQNNGNLNMTNVKLHILGQNKAKVSDKFPVLIGFPTEIIESIIDVDAGQGVVTQKYYFQAPGTDSGQRKIDLVRVTIDDWDADLSYMLTNLATEADSPFATYEAKVLSQ